MPQLMLLDTPTMYYRAYFAVPESITAPDGRPVNAVRGTLDFISHLVTHHRPDQLIACFDADWRPEFRVRLLPSYKAHRVIEERARPVGAEGELVQAASTSVEEVPDTLTPQVEMLLEVLAAFGIADGWAPGFEADDAIAAYAARHRAGGGSGGGGPVDVVTGDRDMFQLISDAQGVRVFNIARGVAKLEVLDDVQLSQKYGVTGAQYADFATLRGDPSDGLPGVASIGEKTAAALLATYGSLDSLRAAAADPDSEFKPAVRKRLAEAAEYLAIAPDVVRVRADADVTPVSPDLPATLAHPEKLEELATRYGLGGPVRRLIKALAAAGAGANT